MLNMNRSKGHDAEEDDLGCEQAHRVVASCLDPERSGGVHGRWAENASEDMGVQRVAEEKVRAADERRGRARLQTHHPDVAQPAAEQVGPDPRVGRPLLLATLGVRGDVRELRHEPLGSNLTPQA